MSHRPMQSGAISGVRAQRSTRASPQCSSLAVCARAWRVAPAGRSRDVQGTDANGRVIYSDQPPTGNFKVEAINAPPPPANPNAVKELASKEAELQQKKMLRADEEAKVAKTKGRDGQEARAMREGARPDRDDAIRPERRCYFRSNEKGEPVYMDDAAPPQGARSARRRG